MTQDREIAALRKVRDAARPLIDKLNDVEGAEPFGVRRTQSFIEELYALAAAVVAAESSR